ncbi:hypothetical protein NDU88_005895 [Pleurodeles waltl]|uniref:Uncharacterized protein n=1 Tax=Pleurodeles waltl TaxID=8319 RepID=A0AAV7SN83_PLEWA|nr:hypothetical protein NDU88_005895 [Pleurodeles waltl]
MAPKASWNPGDKSEGAKTSRTGRDKGELAGLNKRLTSTTGKAAGKNTSGLMKDAKMSDSTTSLLEIKLKEESDLGSADCSFSETDESETSEEGNKSPSGEFTVRKVRQRKCVKSRSGSQEGSENMASMSSRTLRWDYSGIGLADTPTVGNQGPPMIIMKVIWELRLGALATPVILMRWAPRQGYCSQYTVQLKSYKQRPGSTAEEDDSTNLLGSRKKWDKIMGGGEIPN